MTKYLDISRLGVDGLLMSFVALLTNIFLLQYQIILEARDLITEVFGSW